jgi:abortive infection bacteriophage resistance protein
VRTSSVLAPRSTESMLSHFDRAFKHVLWDALERVEVALRSQVADVLGRRGPFAHEEPANLDPRRPSGRSRAPRTVSGHPLLRGLAARPQGARLQRVFASVCVLRLLLEEVAEANDVDAWRESMVSVVSAMPGSTGRTVDEMGFHPGWEQDALWR